MTRFADHKFTIILRTVKDAKCNDRSCFNETYLGQSVIDEDFVVYITVLLRYYGHKQSL